MTQGKIFLAGMLTAALIFGVISAGCGNGTTPGGEGDNTFVAVTNITDVPTAAIKDNPLTLSATVEPSDATNKTIVWSGNSVIDGVLTAAAAGKVTVTATIENGASESSPFTQTFDITVYDAGSSDGTNPFGNDTNPFIWVMDNTGGSVYVIIKDSSWAAMANKVPYNNGTYSRIGGSAAKWTVTGGAYGGDNGLAIIENGKIHVANFTHELSSMNGTFTKLNPGKLTITNIPQYNGRYAFAHTTSDGMDAGLALLFAGKIAGTATAEAVEITGGRVELPVYKGEIEDRRITAGYDESGTINMDIVIMSSKVIPSTDTNHPANWVANDEAPITFTKGVATLDGGNTAVIDWDGDD
jgi:hypothetical protein